jgi:hypothetical protein
VRLHRFGKQGRSTHLEMAGLKKSGSARRLSHHVWPNGRSTRTNRMTWCWAPAKCRNCAPAVARGWSRRRSHFIAGRAPLGIQHRALAPGTQHEAPAPAPGPAPGSGPRSCSMTPKRHGSGDAPHYGT